MTKRHLLEKNVETLQNRSVFTTVLVDAYLIFTFMSKVVRFHTLGDADVLKLEDFPLEEPKAGEVRLKVEAIGLNRAEVAFR